MMEKIERINKISIYFYFSAFVFCLDKYKALGSY